MKLKFFLFFLFASSFVAIGFWVVRSGTRSESHSKISASGAQQRVETKPRQRGSAFDIANKLADLDKQRETTEGRRLVVAARAALEENRIQEFERLIVEILRSYEGDPNPLLMEFSDLLDHEDPYLRIRIAGYLLLTNLEVQDAVQTLQDIVSSDAALVYGQEESGLLNERYPASDFRFRAADTLALYRIEEARDSVWELYQKTGADELVKPLRRLNHPLMIERLKVQALKNPTSLESMKLIGEYRIKEALPEFKKICGRKPWF